MKIAVLSDTHDNLPNFTRVVSWMKKERIKVGIHCGDICAPFTLAEALKDFKGEFHVVFGNVDGDKFGMLKVVQKKLPRVHLHGEWGSIKKGGKNIAFVHFPELARGLASQETHDMVFYGHTHKPWEEKIGACRVVNPGNVANLIFKPTFAVYDTKSGELELKLVDTL